MIPRKEVQRFAEILQNKLKDGFRAKRLSGNLMNTIEINDVGDHVEVSIPAQVYNMLLYQTRGVIVHYGSKSYASKLDEQGSSFMVYPHGTRSGSYRVSPGNHKGFVDQAIKEALQEWASGKYEIKSTTGMEE